MVARPIAAHEKCNKLLSGVKSYLTCKKCQLKSYQVIQVRVCEGGKLVKKAKEEVPQPFVIGCGGGQCTALMQFVAHNLLFLIIS